MHYADMYACMCVCMNTLVCTCHTDEDGDDETDDNNDDDVGDNDDHACANCMVIVTGVISWLSSRCVRLGDRLHESLFAEEFPRLCYTSSRKYGIWCCRAR